MTFPVLSTVDTDAFELVQITVLSAASSGLTVAVRVSEVPSLRLSSVLFSVTEETGIETVRLQFAVLPLASTVIVAEPLALAETRPVGLTVATVWLEEDQVTDLSVALDGLTVEESWTIPPIKSSKEEGETLTEETGTSAGGV